MSETKNKRMCVSIDLHKTQFTVCALDEEAGVIDLEGEFRTNVERYSDVVERMHEIESV